MRNSQKTACFIALLLASQIGSVANAQRLCVPPPGNLPGASGQFATPWDAIPESLRGWCRNGIDVRPWRNALLLSNEGGSLRIHAVVHDGYLYIRAQMEGAPSAREGVGGFAQLNVAIGSPSGTLRYYPVSLTREQPCSATPSSAAVSCAGWGDASFTTEGWLGDDPCGLGSGTAIDQSETTYEAHARTIGSDPVAECGSCEASDFPELGKNWQITLRFPTSTIAPTDRIYLGARHYVETGADVPLVLAAGTVVQDVTDLPILDIDTSDADDCGPRVAIVPRGISVTDSGGAGQCANGQASCIRTAPSAISNHFHVSAMVQGDPASVLGTTNPASVPVSARFRIADWGSAGNNTWNGQYGWNEIPNQAQQGVEGLSGNTLTLGGEPVTFDHCAYARCGSGSNCDSCPAGDCVECSPSDGQCIPDGCDSQTTVRRAPHQCVYAELSQSGPNPNGGPPIRFQPASTYRNMNFVSASTFERIATIATAEPNQTVYLGVSTRNMPLVERYRSGARRWRPVSLDRILALARRGRGGTVPQPWLEELGVSSYVVHVYRATGETLDGADLVEEMPSFGFYVGHEGAFEGFEHWIEGAERLSPNFWRVQTNEHGVVNVNTVIHALEDGAEAPEPRETVCQPPFYDNSCGSDCSADGNCDPLCRQGVDPDCLDCSANGTCNAACDTGADPDCSDCSADGTCNAACDAGADPDCCQEGCGADPNCPMPAWVGIVAVLVILLIIGGVAWGRRRSGS